MTLKSIVINGDTYNYYYPDSYTDRKLLLKQKKRIAEKIRACEVGGCYHNKISKAGKPWYSSYPELLAFLETLLNKNETI